MADHSIPAAAYDGDKPFAFISYSHDDTETVAKFLSSLSGHFRFWYDEGIKSGAEWVEVIGEKIYSCEIFVIFLSQKAITSRYINDEIHYAYKFAKKMLAVNLEPVSLSRSMEFMLERFQYINCWEQPDLKASVDKFLEGLPSSIQSLPEGADPTNKEVLPSDPGAEPAEPNRIFTDSMGNLDVSAEKTFSSSYLVTSHLGRGGSSEVLVVRSRNTGAQYVMKHQHFGGPGSSNDRIGKASARNELEKLLILHEKPYTPTLVDYLEDEENSYLIMSRIQGLNLRDALKEAGDSLTAGMAVSLIGTAARILYDIQKMDLVYGDVKPSNFILNPFGQLFLIDFGSTGATGDSNYLKIFTPKYAAPEQREMMAVHPDFRFDVYSLGVFFRELMTGLTPIRYSAADEAGLAAAEKIYTRMTEPNPNNRYANMGEVCAALDMILPDGHDDLLRSFANSITNWQITKTAAQEQADMEEETVIPSGLGMPYGAPAPSGMSPWNQSSGRFPSGADDVTETVFQNAGSRPAFHMAPGIQLR